jgi:hypothetical protein
MSDRPSAALGAALSETACVSPPIHPSMAPVRPPTRRLRLAGIGQRRREQRGARTTPGHASKARRTPQEAAPAAETRRGRRASRFGRGWSTGRGSAAGRAHWSAPRSLAATERISRQRCLSARAGTLSCHARQRRVRWKETWLTRQPHEPSGAESAALRCAALRCAVQCSAVQCSTAQHSAEQRSRVP